jgi:hypothetical protein
MPIETARDEKKGDLMRIKTKRHVTEKIRQMVSVHNIANSGVEGGGDSGFKMGEIQSALKISTTHRSDFSEQSTLQNTPFGGHQ